MRSPMSGTDRTSGTSKRSPRRTGSSLFLSPPAPLPILESGEHDAYSHPLPTLGEGGASRRVRALSNGKPNDAEIYSEAVRRLNSDINRRDGHHLHLYSVGAG